MAVSTLQEIVADLVISTATGVLTWEKDKSNPAMFNVEIKSKFLVSVWEWVDQDTDDKGFSVSLKRQPYTTDPIDFVSSNQYGSRSGVISELYAAARRSALNVAPAVQEIKDFLDIPF